MRSPQYFSSQERTRSLVAVRGNQQERVVEDIDEPPSCPSNPSCTSNVIIGRNSRGNWVAQENNGLFGGLFVSRAQALKYALFENGHHPETIVVTTNIVELDMHRKVSPQAAKNAAIDADSSLQSRAA
jgi:hypothetical protein